MTITPILTKYITSDIYRKTSFSKAFLELIDECLWCWHLESREILNTLSYEDMEIDTLLKVFDSYGINLKNYKDVDLNRYTLLHWFTIMHNRGLLKTMESVVSVNGELNPTETSNIDLTLYHNADVPYDVVANPEDGYIYAVTSDSSLDIQDDSFLKQTTPAGYRIMVVKQLPPILVNDAWKLYTNIEKHNSITIIDNTIINVNSEKIKGTAFYHSPQFDETYNFSQLYKSGYSINNLSTLHLDHKFFSFEITNSTTIELELHYPSGIIQTDDIIYFENDKENEETLYDYALMEKETTVISNGIEFEIHKMNNEKSFTYEEFEMEEAFSETLLMDNVSYIPSYRNNFEDVSNNIISTMNGVYLGPIEYGLMNTESGNDIQYLLPNGSVAIDINMELVNIIQGEMNDDKPTPLDELIIGVDSIVEQGVVTLYSDYYWVTGFTSTADGGKNPYSSTHYPTITPNDSGSVEVPGLQFDEAIYDGNDKTKEMYPFTNSDILFRLSTYGSTPEFYVSGDSVDTSLLGIGENSALIVKPNSNCTSVEDRDYNLEGSNLFTIESNKIIWNVNSPLYRLLYGKKAYTRQLQKTQLTLGDSLSSFNDKDIESITFTRFYTCNELSIEFENKTSYYVIIYNWFDDKIGDLSNMFDFDPTGSFDISQSLLDVRVIYDSFISGAAANPVSTEITVREYNYNNGNHTLKLNITTNFYNTNNTNILYYHSLEMRYLDGSSKSGYIPFKHWSSKNLILNENGYHYWNKSTEENPITEYNCYYQYNSSSTFNIYYREKKEIQRTSNVLGSPELLDGLNITKMSCVRYYKSHGVVVDSTIDTTVSNNIIVSYQWTDEYIGDLTGKFDLDQNASFDVLQSNYVFHCIFYDDLVGGFCAKFIGNTSYEITVRNYTYNNGQHTLLLNINNNIWNEHETDFKNKHRFMIRYIDNNIKAGIPPFKPWSIEGVLNKDGTSYSWNEDTDYERISYYNLYTYYGELLDLTFYE